MPWGQENQAREAAAALFKLVGEIEKDLTRLQEQQRSDEGRYKELRRDLAEMRVKVQALEVRYKDFEELSERIQLIEMTASVIGADLSDLAKEFDAYRIALEQRANQLRADKAVAEAERNKKFRYQIGGIGAAFFLGLSPALPKIYEWIVALIERLTG